MHQVPARNPKYSAADLWPPGSKGNVDFPPSAFHPVYLGNFMCHQQQELVARVQQYFASKGLLARMVFARDAANDPFRGFQNKNKLFDCLVYFTRKQDAEDAVTYLHREKYFGHRLNIFPGRVRCYFEPGKTLHLARLPGFYSDAPVQLIEDGVRKIAGLPTVCSAQNIPNQVLVEFCKPGDVQQAIRFGKLNNVQLTALQTAVPKQRFIEQDVKHEIRAVNRWLQLPSSKILKALYEEISVTLKLKMVNKKPTIYPRVTKAKYRQKTPSQHDFVMQALKRILQTAGQRQLDIKLYRAMFPDAYKQFMAILQASLGDTEAGKFLSTFRPPWQMVNRPLTQWESAHVQLHNVGLDFIQVVIRNRRQ